jgi:hypothetical protein
VSFGIEPAREDKQLTIFIFEKCRRMAASMVGGVGTATRVHLNCRLPDEPAHLRGLMITLDRRDDHDQAPLRLRSLDAEHAWSRPSLIRVPAGSPLRSTIVAPSRGIEALRTADSANEYSTDREGHSSLLLDGEGAEYYATLRLLLCLTSWNIAGGSH